MNSEKVKQIAEDLSAVLKESKSMGCTEVKYFYHIPLENVEVVVKALEKQIPKKLDVWADGTEHCPNCEHDNSCLGFKICVNCGQKLDW